jgi:hypothetical protein
MSDNQERFCGLMAEVTCPECPVRNLSEQTWTDGLRPGVSPFEAATHVASELIAVNDEILDEERGLELEGLDMMRQGEAQGEPTQIELRRDDVAEALHATILPLSDDIMQSVEQARPPSDDIADTVNIIRALGGCVEKQFARDCSIGNLLEQISGALPNLIDKGFGSAVLDTIGRHGSAEEARRMAAIVQGALDDILERIELQPSASKSPNFNDLPVAVARDYLLQVAEVLESGVLGE